MKIKTSLKHVSLLLLTLLGLSHSAFYDCLLELKPLRSDEAALALIKSAHSQKLKFSSECLETVLRKNFFLSSDYLLTQYYPKTTIDTELILRNVGAEVKRDQD